MSDDLEAPPAEHIAGLKAWLWAAMQRVTGGVKCPVCNQHAMVYKRHVTAAMARVLIVAYREHGVGKSFRLPELLERLGQRGGDSAKLRYWGLLASLADSRDPDEAMTGWWQVTDTGAAFITGDKSIPYTCLVYDGQVRGFEGDDVTIRDCLGKRFDYAELMWGDGLWAATP